MVTIAKLPVEILLEIFDFYRQKFDFERQRNYDRSWNNKNGWFKLAHVCRKWRSVVLTFSSRLQLRLFFEAQTPTRAAVLTALSSLPIVVDYRRQLFWNVALQNRLTSALRYPLRVYKIALSVTYTNRDMIHKALDFSFPILESLELHGISVPGLGQQRRRGLSHRARAGPGRKRHGWRWAAGYCNSMPRLPGLASGSGPSSGPGLALPRSSSVRDRSFVNAAAAVAAAEFPRQPLAASCSANAQAAMAGAFPSMTLYAAPVPAAVTNRWLHVA